MWLEQLALASSIVNESIRAILNLFIFFLQEDFTHTNSTKTHTSEQKQKKQHFYAHKKYLSWGKSLVRLLAPLWFLCFLCFLVCETKKDSIFMRIKTSKRKKIACLTFCAFYAHKKHLRGRKSLVWRFVLFVLFMLFMRIKNI